MVLSLVGFPFIGESPKYYLASNDFEKAVQSLTQIAERNRTELPPGRLVKIEEDDEEDRRGNVWDLVPNFTYTRLTVLVMFSWALNSFIYFGVILLTPGRYAMANN